MQRQRTLGGSQEIKIEGERAIIIINVLKLRFIYLFGLGVQKIGGNL